MAKSFFPILCFENAEPIASANPGSASRFQSDVSGPAWLRSPLCQDDVMKALIALFLACASTFAADLRTTAQTNGLRASLYFTDSEVFGTRTNGFGLPQFPRISKVSRGVWFATALVFSGPGLRADGTADISFGIVVRKSDGSVMQELDGMTVTKARFSASDRASHLARDTQGICVSPDAPAGTYTVVATLKDQVKNVRLTLQRQFTIEK